MPTRNIRRKTNTRMEKSWIKRISSFFFDSFDGKSKIGNRLKNWLLFFVLGLVVMAGIQSFKQYDFSEADTLTSETGAGCDMMAMMLLLILPPLEEGLFRIAPFHFFGKKGAFVGSVLWAILHVLGRNWAIVGFQLVMSMFYFKLVTSGRFTESVLFHEAFNMLPLMTCFLL
jgi:hypothetical protein